MQHYLSFLTWIIQVCLINKRLLKKVPIFLDFLPGDDIFNNLRNHFDQMKISNTDLGSTFQEDFMMLEQKANLLKEKHAEENSQLAQNSMLESSSPNSNTGKMKDKMNKLLQKPGGIPFWKK